MKYKLILFILILLSLYSCEENENVLLKNYLVIGNTDAKISVLDTLITPPDRCDSIIYEIDLDKDKVIDYSFYVYYCYSPSYFSSIFKFNCLHEKAKVLINDSIFSPEILEVGDTLKNDKNWLSMNMTILTASGASEIVGGDGIIYKNGNWFDVTNKYIGLIINKKENPIYGWIKISVPNENWVYSLTIHETGYIKATYNE